MGGGLQHMAATLLGVTQPLQGSLMLFEGSETLSTCRWPAPPAGVYKAWAVINGRMTAVPLRIPRAFYVDAAAAPGTPGGRSEGFPRVCAGRQACCLHARGGCGRAPDVALQSFEPHDPCLPCTAEAAGFGQQVKRTLPGGVQPMHTYHVRREGTCQRRPAMLMQHWFPFWAPGWHAAALPLQTPVSEVPHHNSRWSWRRAYITFHCLCTAHA